MYIKKYVPLDFGLACDVKTKQQKEGITHILMRLGVLYDL